VPKNRERGMPDWLDPQLTTICDLLKQAGYVTGHFGKWHLSGPLPNAPSPGEYGIDDHRTVVSRESAWPVREADDPYFRTRSSDLFVDQAIRFLDSNKGRPFYINLWTLVPHALLNPTPEQLAAYDGLQPDPDDFEKPTSEYLRRAHNLDAQMKIYCASITGMDNAIGRLLNYLDEHGLARNTLVAFSSDNGPEDYHVSAAQNAGVGSTGPLRARKRSLFEGGVRTPLIVRWPGRIPAGRVDARSVLTAVDFLPSLCALAGVNVPDELRPDGEDVSDILCGQVRPRRRPILWEWRFGVAGDPSYRPPGLAIRDGDWKLLIERDGSGAQLYHIVQDPSETTNLVEQHPDVAERLTDQLLAWQRTLPQTRTHQPSARATSP
jgi:N-acetylgalactosamine-6-sulfatase